MQDGGTWIVEGDTDGNGQADFVLAVTRIDGQMLGASDFML